MSELAVYFVRAMDARPIEDIVSDDKKYTELLRTVDGVIVNPFEQESRNPVEDGLRVAEHDLASLETSDVVLADLSVPDYQYVGCIFEMVHAAVNSIPVIVVVGARDFPNRIFFQAYCDFIARDAAEAVEYIRRAHTRQSGHL